MTSFGFNSTSEFNDYLRGMRERSVEELSPWVHLPDEPVEDTVQRLQAQIAVLQRTLSEVMSHLERAARGR
jgi:hypothetical protein